MARRVGTGISGALTAAVAAALLLPTQHASAEPPTGTPSGGLSDAGPDAVARQLAEGIQVAPKGDGATAQRTAGAATADPYRALVPDPAAVDYRYWKERARQAGAARAAQDVGVPTDPSAARALAAQEAALFYQEREGIRRGANDRPANAEPIVGLGTGEGDTAEAFVLGRLAPQAAATPTNVPANAEDDGSIPLAGDPGVQAVRRAAATTGTIGDGPFGTTGDGSGDHDFWELTLRAGQEVTLDARATGTGADSLDGLLVLYDAAGEIVAVNDDRGSGDLNPLVTFTAPAAGTYYAMLMGFGTGLPTDPFTSGSGTGTGDTGPYSITLSTRTVDVDYYRVDLEAGDVLGGSLSEGAALLEVVDPAGTLVVGSTQDASFLYAPEAPLPGGGNAVLAHVAEFTGPHYVGVRSGEGLYTIDLGVYRPGPEDRPTRVEQVLYLDFDGARVNTGVFGGPGVRDLSPLSAFLGNWGLAADDEDALIDGIIREVRENVLRDLQESGLNDRIAVRILNSRDHGERFGRNNVSRVVVGGTIAESGINTIGIAQYIDPGNYGTEDSALVLLDVLSAEPGPVTSLNTYITEESDRLGFIAQAVGNVTSHEAGHFLGSYHVDQFNEVANLMDQGGNFPLLYGVGPDGIGGTADDTDVDFGKDVFNPNEGFAGIEDTAVRTAWALTRGSRPV